MTDDPVAELTVAVRSLADQVRLLVEEVQRLSAAQPRISYRVPEAVEMTGVSRSEMYRLVRDGAVRKVPNVGERTVVIPHSELERRFGTADDVEVAADVGSVDADDESVPSVEDVQTVGPLLTTPEAARYLGIGRSTLLRWVELGIAPKPIIDTENGRRRFARAALDEWARRNGQWEVGGRPETRDER